MVHVDVQQRRSSGIDLGGWIRRNAARPGVAVAVGLGFAALCFGAGRHAYLLIALALLFIAVVLAGCAFSSGVLWILGFSTVTGFYQRLVLHTSGQPPATDYIRFALELSILLYVALVALTWLSKRRQSARVRLIGLDLLVGLYLLLSTLYTFNLFYVEPLVTIYGWRWVAIPIFMYTIGRIIATQPGMIDRVNKYMLVLLLLQGGYGAYQSVIGYPPFEQAWVQLNAATQAMMAVEDSMFIAGKARIPALTEGHISGGFLIPILFLWSLFVPGRSLSKRWRTVQRLALVCGLLYLVFSNERSSLGMAAIGIAFVVFLHARRRLGIGVFLISLPLLVLLIFGMSRIDPSQIPWSADTIVQKRLLELLNPFKSGTLAGRMTVYWPVYWGYFLDNPLGYGLGTFHSTSATQGSQWGLSPHNMYLQALLEVGVAGLALFVAIWVAFFFNLYRYSKRRLPTLHKGPVYSAAAAYVAFAAIGVANQPIETFPLALHFWFLMGVVTTYLTARMRPIPHA